MPTEYEHPLGNFLEYLAQHNIPRPQVSVTPCKDWCESIMVYIPGTFKTRRLVLGIEESDFLWRKIRVHYWLEKNEDGEVFVSDRFAGSFDTNYPNGYYGLLNSASEELKSLYNHIDIDRT